LWEVLSGWGAIAVAKLERLHFVGQTVSQ
jgi:hypothetical protein